MTGEDRSPEAARAALRARMRGLGPADMDVNNALALYIWAMMVLAGQSTGTAGFVMYRWLLQMDKRALPFDDETEAVLRGILGMTELRTEHGPRTRKRRDRLYCPYPMIRLSGLKGRSDAHYVTAWFVEQVRKQRIRHRGSHRLPPGELDAIIDCMVDLARERFGMHLDAIRVHTIINEPKSRRHTKIFYRDC